MVKHYNIADMVFYGGMVASHIGYIWELHNHILFSTNGIYNQAIHKVAFFHPIDTYDIYLTCT